jgi:hypothetical protein
MNHYSALAAQLTGRGAPVANPTKMTRGKVMQQKMMQMIGESRRDGTGAITSALLQSRAKTRQRHHRRNFSELFVKSRHIWNGFLEQAFSEES